MHYLGRKALSGAKANAVLTKRTPVRIEFHDDVLQSKQVRGGYGRSACFQASKKFAETLENADAASISALQGSRSQFARAAWFNLIVRGMGQLG
jgi:hypothetical protein